MHTLNISQAVRNQTLHLTLVGEVQDTSILPELKLDGISDIIFDLSKISHINSGGIHSWILWMTKLGQSLPGGAVAFRQIPPVMFKQIINVVSLIPKKSKIKSAEIPFFCEDCGVAASKLFEPERDFVALKPKKEIIEAMCDLRCPTCGKVMDVDIFPEQYFEMFERHR